MTNHLISGSCAAYYQNRYFHSFFLRAQSQDKNKSLASIPRSRATWEWTKFSFCPVLSRKCTLQPSMSTSIHLWRPGPGDTAASTPAWPTRVRLRWAHWVSHTSGFRPSEKALHRMHSLWGQKKATMKEQKVLLYFLYCYISSKY